MSDKWEIVWTIFGYRLSWYGKKFYFYIPIHTVIGAVVSLPAFFIISQYMIPPVEFRVILFITSIFLGGCIEWTQVDKTGKKWVDRKVWLLGAMRDVVTYSGLAWVVFI